MSKPLITRGQYRALVKTWHISPTIGPKGVQWRTLDALETLGYLESERRDGGHWVYWLSDAGKEVMDQHVKVYGALP